MTNFLQWRKMTWALLLWSAAMTAWILIGSISATQVGVLWAAGMLLLGLLWLGTQPLFQQGRGLSGVFVKPGKGHWRGLNLHRTHQRRPSMRHAYHALRD
jgi:uncharacterized protein (DUF58 family)